MKDWKESNINLIKEAINFALKDMDKPTKSMGKTISKIKKL